MFELITIAVFGWLMVKSVGLALRLTWGLTKIIAAVLLFMAFPALIGCLLFLGGLALLIPIGLVGIAFCVLNA